MDSTKFLRVFGTVYLVVAILGVILEVIATSITLSALGASMNVMVINNKTNTPEYAAASTSFTTSLLVMIVVCVIMIASGIFIFLVGQMVSSHEYSISSLLARERKLEVTLRKQEENTGAIEKAKKIVGDPKVGDTVKLKQSKFFSKSNIRLPGKTEGVVSEVTDIGYIVKFQTMSCTIEEEVEKDEVEIVIK